MTLIGGLIISHVLLFIVYVVKFISKGLIFYGQVRMGGGGNEIKNWKFRSMVTGKANTEGWTVKYDPSIIKIGKILRKN